jgi:hypothetical protein
MRELIAGPYRGQRPASPAAYPAIRSPDPDVDAGQPKYRCYIQLATGFENNPEKGRKERGTASKRGPKREKDTDMMVETAGTKRRKGDEAEEVSRKLKTKWRQLEEKDLKDMVAMMNEELNEGARAMAAPKLGRRSRYIDALQALTDHIIQKKVHNKETWVPVSSDDADDYIEVVRGIISPSDCPIGSTG